MEPHPRSPMLKNAHDQHRHHLASARTSFRGAHARRCPLRRWQAAGHGADLSRRRQAQPEKFFGNEERPFVMRRNEFEAETLLSNLKAKLEVSRRSGLVTRRGAAGPSSPRSAMRTAPGSASAATQFASVVLRNYDPRSF